MPNRATTIGASVAPAIAVTPIGTKAIPVSIALIPSTLCIARASRKNIPMNAAPFSSWATLPVDTPRFANSRSGTSGADERDSIATNVASSATLAAMSPSVRAEPQPCWSVPMTA